MDNKRLITIAIDGFSSSGKSTMAKKLAKTIGYAYIDTGAMYRAVTLYCLRNGCLTATASTPNVWKQRCPISISRLELMPTEKRRQCSMEKWWSRRYAVWRCRQR